MTFRDESIEFDSLPFTVMEPAPTGIRRIIFLLRRSPVPTIGRRPVEAMSGGKNKKQQNKEATRDRNLSWTLALPQTTRFCARKECDV
jgi:hypothetical protein